MNIVYYMCPLYKYFMHSVEIVFNKDYERKWVRCFINMLLRALFPIKKYDKWHPLPSARLACRHGRQPRLDQYRDAIKRCPFRLMRVLITKLYTSIVKF